MVSQSTNQYPGTYQASVIPAEIMQFGAAVKKIALGDLSNARAELLFIGDKISGSLSGKELSFDIPSLAMPPVFGEIFRSFGPWMAKPLEQRPALDIAGLVFLGAMDIEHDYTTKKTTYRWCMDPLATIDASRRDDVISKIEPGLEPLISAPISALLSDFSYWKDRRAEDFSIENFAAATRAGYPLGDPELLAAAIFNPRNEKDKNLQRWKAVSPHLPQPLPGPIRDILWTNALIADTGYYSNSPQYKSKTKSAPGYCQQILLDHGIAPALERIPPAHGDVLKQAFQTASEHLVPMLLSALSRSHQEIDAKIMTRALKGMSGKVYTEKEQARLASMIDQFGFHSLANKCLSLPLNRSNLNTPLHYAIGRGNFTLARKFIQMGASTTATNKAKQTPLECCKKRSRKMIAQLNSLATMIPMEPADRQFMLLKACRSMDAELACNMIDQGADLFRKSRGHDVIREMFTDTIKLTGSKHQKAQLGIQRIVNHHVDTHGPLSQENADRLFLEAFRSASPMVVKALIEKGASYHVMDAGVERIYQSRAQKHVKNFIEMMVILADNGMDPDYRTQEGKRVFECVWEKPDFQQAVRSVEQSRQMQAAVAQVPAAETPSRRPMGRL